MASAAPTPSSESKEFPACSPPSPPSATTAGGPSANNTPPTPVAPPHPITDLCGRIYEAFKGERWQEVLMAFEELQSIPGIQDEVEKLPDITKAWGRCLEAAKRCGSDVEHVHEMAEDFEALFGFKSPYLAAIVSEEPDPCDALMSLSRQFEFLGADAVEGVIERFRSLERSEIKRVLALLQKLNITLTQDLSERFQRYYVFRMKEENPETVYKEMLEDGLKPSGPHPFHMLFGHQDLARPPMEYYEEMLHFGIKPLPSTFRLLLKHKLMSREDCSMMRRRAAGNTAMEEKYLERLRQYQHDGKLFDAESLYNRMILEGIAPEKHVFNHIIMCCRNNPDAADEWYQKMLAAGFEPNASTFSNLISVYKDSHQADNMDKWLEEMSHRGVPPDAHFYASVLDSYVRMGNRGKVAKIFKALLEKKEPIHVNVFNAVMKLGPFDWSVGCLALLLAEGLQPTSHTRSALQSQARDETSSTMVTEMQTCQWDRASLLRSELLVTPMRGTTPSFAECMRLMMRDLKMDHDWIEQKTAQFKKEVDKALAAKPRPLM